MKKFIGDLNWEETSSNAQKAMQVKKAVEKMKKEVQKMIDITSLFLLGVLWVYLYKRMKKNKRQQGGESYLVS